MHLLIAYRRYPYIDVIVARHYKSVRTIKRTAWEMDQKMTMILSTGDIDESQPISRDQFKTDVINDYSKMLNSNFPHNSSIPSVVDVSKNFILQPLDKNGGVYVVAKRTRSTKTPTLDKSSLSLSPPTPSINVYTTSDRSKYSKRIKRSTRSRSRSSKRTRPSARSRSRSSKRTKRSTRSRSRSSRRKKRSTKSKFDSSNGTKIPLEMRSGRRRSRSRTRMLKRRSNSPFEDRSLLISPRASSGGRGRYDVDKYMRDRIPY